MYNLRIDYKDGTSETIDNLSLEEVEETGYEKMELENFDRFIATYIGA